MGVGAATFRSAGKISQHYIPGGYSRISAPAGNIGPVSANRGVIVGECTGGKPNEVIWFTSINDAINVLRGGDLLNALRFALSPGGDLIPQMIGAVRVNSAVQASGTLQKSAADIIDIKARDYGLYTNQIKVTVAAGSVSGKKLTVELNEDSQEIDNIEKESINIQYTGDATTAVMTINATTLTTTLAGDQTDGSANLSVAFSTYDTIEKVVGYINSQTGYSCTLVDGVDEEDASNELDAVTAQDIKTAEYTCNSDVQAMIDIINSSSNYLNDAELHSGAARTPVDNVADYFLTGGSEGSAGTTEYTNALTMLEQEDVQVLGTTSDDYAIQALFKTHVDAMNAVTGKKERQAILGALASTTLTLAIAEAKVKNDFAIGFCFGEFKDYDLAGNLQQYGSVFYAAKMIGQFGALDIIQPHTFKEFNAVELVTKLSTVEKEDAIKNGVWVPEISPQGTFRTVRSMSTYQKENLLYNEFSMSRSALYVSRDLRNYLEQIFVGKAGDTTVLQSIFTLSGARLDTYRNDFDLFVDNPNEGWDGNSWKNLNLAINGDQVTVTYDATITAPINFIFITNNFQLLVTL